MSNCDMCGFPKMVPTKSKKHPYTYICGISANGTDVNKVTDEECKDALANVSPYLFAWRGVYVDYEPHIKDGITTKEMVTIYTEAFKREFVSHYEDVDLFGVLSGLRRYVTRLEEKGLCKVVYELSGNSYTDALAPKFTITSSL